MFVEVEITFISNTTLKDINRLSSMCGIVCSFLFVLLIRLQFYKFIFFPRTQKSIIYCVR